MTKSQVPEWVNPIFHAIQFGQFGYLQELLNDRLVAGARDHKRELSQIASSVDSFGANPLIDDLAKTLGWRVNRRTSTNGVLGLLVADFQIYYNRSPERTGLVFQVQTSPDKNYRIGDPSFQKAIAQGIQGAERFLNRYYFPQKERPLAISLRLPHCPEQPLSDEAAQKIFGESIALATALALIMNNKSTLVAATGALDEEGRVKKVGGVVEKLFGLVREVPDCKLVFVPAENKIEIESNHELTQKLRENHITVEYISHLDELFEHPAITIPGADQKPYSRALSIRARSCLQDNKIKALELRLGSHPDANEPYPAGKICLAADFRISEKNWQQL
ncbi:MAG: hypothetical protein ONB05_08415 [candidate division KSB1 bacterium]|nr:hypothetical protein [candidate division KSB1 bacterium]